MSELLWTQKQDVGPSARSDAAMVFDAARSRVVLFGGAGGSAATLFNDTWEWICSKADETAPSPLL